MSECQDSPRARVDAVITSDGCYLVDARTHKRLTATHPTTMHALGELRGFVDDAGPNAPASSPPRPSTPDGE